MDSQALFVSILMFVAVLLAGGGVFYVIVERRKQRVRRRLGELTQVVSEETGEASILRDEALSSIPAPRTITFPNTVGAPFIRPI